MWTVIQLLLFATTLNFYHNLTKRKKNDTNIARKVSFISGLFLLVLIFSYPMLNFSQSYFLVYMLQQTTLYFLVPILILFGLNESLLMDFHIHPLINKIWKILTNPFVSLPLFNILFSLYFFPAIFNTVKVSPLLTIILTIIFILLSFVMWWPIVAPVKNGTTLSPLIKIIYIVGMGAFMTPLAAFLIFTNQILYYTYSVTNLSETLLLNDQQAGGVAMKIMQMLIYCFMIGIAFIEAQKEEEQNRGEELSM
ncbi:cytochrome c oxidase assembly protein [Alkalihalobacillus pseudalcaliphilus]|uniref:cytochrome c oxidase assembly protein n=1 Tax=Alkalihalobacillus pseudalcaliphilus TaxID=79884 RepID=UPI00235E0C5A|nr:cytochrome c oxidase assembly protein [Alkalihalobacillus pseudalcaliphilus]